MAAAFSSSTATARMTVEGAPAWDLATLMPDGAVGASASGGRAVVLAQAVATVFRQIAIHRFEDAVHRERREDGELSVTRLGEHWMAVNRELYGDSLELTDGYVSWWSYVSHVFTSPGYVYAYAYGQLMALAIYARYEEQGEAFVDSYLELLAAGGSRSPQRLGEMVGVDLSDPGFWATGLELIDRNLDEARDVAAAMAA